MPIEINRRTFLAATGAGTMVLPLMACSSEDKGRPYISDERLTGVLSIFLKHSLFSKIDSMFLNQFRPWYMNEALNALKNIKKDVPELEDWSAIDIMEEFLAVENERLDRLENQGSHETLNEWGSFFGLHKVLSGVRRAGRYGSESKSKLVRDVTSLLTTSPASDFKVAMVSLNLQRALEAEKIRQVEVDKRIKQMLSERKRLREIG